MANNVNETKARTIVLDSLKSTVINAGTSIHLTSQEIVVNGSVMKSYPKDVNFGNSNGVVSTEDVLCSNIKISESQVLNGLIVVTNGTVQQDDIDENTTLGIHGNLFLPRVTDLRHISVNQSVDFCIINNHTTSFKLEDGNLTGLGYKTIGHENIYKGTSAMFKLHRNNIANYNVYRLS